MSDVETHKCPTVGEKLAALEDSLVLQFRTATPEQAVKLSTSIKALLRKAQKLANKHDACIDMMTNGEFGYTAEKATRIRKERADKRPKETFADLDF